MGQGMLRDLDFIIHCANWTLPAAASALLISPLGQLVVPDAVDRLGAENIRS